MNQDKKIRVMIIKAMAEITKQGRWLIKEYGTKEELKKFDRDNKKIKKLCKEL